MKQAIFTDGNETRALINNLNVQNLQTQLADAKNQNSNLSQSLTVKAMIDSQTNTILTHLIPANPTVA